MDNHQYEASSYYRPLSPWAYIGYSILFCLPFVGLIFIIVFSVNDANANRRSFARAYLYLVLIGIILGIVLFFSGLFPMITQTIRSYSYMR